MFEYLFKFLSRASKISSAILLKGNITIVLLLLPKPSPSCFSVLFRRLPFPHCSPFIKSYGLLTGRTLAGSMLPTPYILKSINCLLSFFFFWFIYLLFASFLFYLKLRGFLLFGPIQCAQKSSKLLKEQIKLRFCLFLILLFLLPQLVNIRNKGLHTR